MTVTDDGTIEVIRGQLDTTEPVLSEHYQWLVRTSSPAPGAQRFQYAQELVSHLHNFVPGRTPSFPAAHLETTVHNVRL